MFASLLAAKSARPARRARSFLPRLEALEGREVPTVGFSVTGSVMTITGDDLGNRIDLTNDGNGLIRATGIDNYPESGISGIRTININTHDGTDRVFFNQGTTTSSVNLRQNLTLNVNLGGNSPFTFDTFSATVNGNIGFVNSSGVQARTLDINVNGGEGTGSDDIRVRADNDVDVLEGSTLRVNARGGGGDDLVALDYEGRLQGFLFLELGGGDGRDGVSAQINLDEGSSAVIEGANKDAFGNRTPALVRGDGGADGLTFHITEDRNADVSSVRARMDAGLDFEQDFGSYTAAFVDDVNFIPALFNGDVATKA